MMKDEPLRSLINETNNAFTKAVNTGITQSMPEAIRQSFQKDVFIFSGMKTYAQLKEASQLLLDSKGNIKPWQQFKQDILSINDKYNKSYLEAEYNYAVASAQMADKWQDLAKDADRYFLQYRTAGDNRVRPEHEILNKITLPATDEFWDKYYPPNGWNCRCTVVKVLRTRYTASESGDSIKKGENATTKLDKNGNNAAAIFRMNAGKQQIIFPANHPYTAKGNADKNKAKEIVVNLQEQKKNYELLDANERFQVESERAEDNGLLEVYKELDKYEAASIHMYTMTDGYYGYINKYNRTGTVSLGARADEFNAETLESMTKVINSGLDKIPDKHVGKVYRGTSLKSEELAVYENAWRNNEEHIEQTFMSSTMKESNAFNGNTKFIIESKTGSKVDKLSAVEDEEEVLFKAGQKFKITNIDYNNGTNIIYMEEI